MFCFAVAGNQDSIEIGRETNRDGTKRGKAKGTYSSDVVTLYAKNVSGKPLQTLGWSCGSSRSRNKGSK